MGFNAVDPGLYQYDEGINSLPSDEFRVLHVLWFREPRHWLGVARFRPADILPQLPPDWSEQRVQEAVSGLVERGLALWDPGAKLIFLRPALEHDKSTRGERSVIGAYESLRALPDVPLLLPALKMLAPAMHSAIAGIKKGENLQERRQRLADLAEVVEHWCERLLRQKKEAPPIPHGYPIDGVSENDAAAAACPMDTPSMGHAAGGPGGKKVPTEAEAGEKILPKNGVSMGHLARAGYPSPAPDRPPPKGGSKSRPGLLGRWLGGKGGQNEP